MQGLDFGPRPRTDNPMKETWKMTCELGFYAGIYVYIYIYKYMIIRTY